MMNNKTAIITGGARRLGGGIAKRMFEEGWDLALIYRTSEKENLDKIKDYAALNGRRCLLLKADLRDENHIISAFEKIKSYFGEINVLINNAGIFPKATNLNETEAELWDSVIDTNLRAYFLCAKYFLNCKSEKSRIINIGSLGGLETWRGRIPYNTSKAGVIQLTKSLALDLAPLVSVNCINPGTIEITDEESPFSRLIPPERIPMQRRGNVDDIYSAVKFFLQCSDFITGQYLNIDGGYALAR